MSAKLEWHSEKRKISELEKWPQNPREIREKDFKDLQKSIDRFGLAEPLVIQPDGLVIGGHARLEALKARGDKECDCYVPNRELNQDELAELNIRLNKNIAGTWDLDLLSSFDTDLLLNVGFTDEELSSIFQLDMSPEPVEGEDDIPDPPAEPKSKLGDLYQLGQHRLLCGDSMKREDVERLMGGEKAELLFADPPYGMGKEKDGILNDNLYREKLDAFQMAWWKEYRLFLSDNASAYIWGNAEDLWRLWYCGGLKDSERLTFRNEIIWNKKNGQGINSEDFRSYAPITERCLFFMLGEQGFNNNADNYWESWTPIVDYLENQRQLMGWSIKDTKRIAGHSEKNGCHWFDKSQWLMPTEEVYKKWQHAANGKAFKREYDELKREYDELKREFYKTRAYFDNTHEDMTDVWEFDRVIGEERFGHASPKSVKMTIRAIKSSSHEESNIIDPFGGTGPTLIACEEINRRCFMMELSPIWIDTIILRWEKFSGQKAVKL